MTSIKNLLGSELQVAIEVGTAIAQAAMSGGLDAVEAQIEALIVKHSEAIVSCAVTKGITPPAHGQPSPEVTLRIQLATKHGWR